jgi:DNA repair protein RecN (Recombination protein N)
LEFEQKEKQQRSVLQKCAEKLSKARQKVAKEFSEQVTNELKTLGFLNAEFSVIFETITLAQNGFDRIDFLVSPNPGIPAQPLRKIGSSGEISRVMLAIKTVLAESDSVPILIFDEIDVNIGGEAAICVANELKKLAETHQLLCISHLPTVAAKADSHFLVKKEVIDEITVTQITELSKSGRLKEITRMLGGGKAATNHAKELLT